MEADLVKCLSDAADLIEKGGLAKAQFEDFRQRQPGSLLPAYCMIGAIRAACPDNLGELSMGTPYDKPVVKLLGFKGMDEAFRWNDRKVRKKEEVVARLRLAAERERLGPAATSAYSGSSS